MQKLNLGFHPLSPRRSHTMLADVSVQCFTALVIPVETTRCLQLDTVSKPVKKKRSCEWTNVKGL